MIVDDSQVIQRQVWKRCPLQEHPLRLCIKHLQLNATLAFLENAVRA